MLLLPLTPPLIYLKLKKNLRTKNGTLFHFFTFTSLFTRKDGSALYKKSPKKLIKKKVHQKIKIALNFMREIPFKMFRVQCYIRNPFKTNLE